jgi:probable phosphoglycerate mutase
MLIVVRHGQAEGNTAHRFIGWSDVPLDDTGVAQAETVAERLAAVGVERIVSSDIRRARQTAEPLARRTGIEIEFDDRVREISNGAWTGMLPAEIAARWPEMWDDYINGEDVDRPDGERWAEVRTRMTAALAELAEVDAVTAVFTHGGPTIISAEWALGISLPGNIFRGPLAAPPNTSITTIDDGRLLSYADAGHLGRIEKFTFAYEPVAET